MRTVLISVLLAILLFVLPASAGEIHDLAKGGHLAAVKALLSENPTLVDSVDDRGSTPLHSACHGGNLDVVKFLLEKGANIEAVNAGGFTPLQLAAYGGHRQVVELLLDRGAKPNVTNDQMQMAALDFALLKEIQAGKLSVAPLLIENGAEFDVNKRNRFGYSPLDMAIVFGSTEPAKYLIGLGADVNSVRLDGNTPLINAIKRGRPEIAKLLIEKHVDVNAPDNEGNPPIRWAVEKGLSEVVALLLANRTRLDFIDKREGRTLLHIAALKGYKDLVDILLVKGLDVNAEDNLQRTPLYYAAKYGHKGTADLLVRRGAKSDGKMEKNYGKSRYLNDLLMNKEVVAWYLTNRGWAVKTQSHMLIFDSEEFGVTRPTEPCLANGFLTPQELADENVVAIYTSYHGEPGEPAYIHEIEDSVASITYVHNDGDPWRGSDRTIYMKPREEKKVDDMQIVSALVPGSMPMLAYLCMVDGLSIFYSAFQPEDIEIYKEEIDFLAQHNDQVDLAFLPIAEPGMEDSASIYLLEKLHPKAVFPLDPDRREHHFPNWAEMVAEKGFPAEVFCAENPGDHFFLHSPK